MSGRPAAGPANGRFAVRRKPRRDWRPVALRAGLGLLVAIGLAGAAWWLLTSPLFAVSRVESGAYRFTAQADLERTLGTFLGRNLWTLSTDEVAVALARLPWVRDLRVLRRLPGTLEVDFREWRPLLVVAHGRDTVPRVLLGDGRVLPFPEHLSLPGLPVLVGAACLPDSAGAGWRLDPQLKAPVLDLLAAMEASGLEAARPVDFVVARDEGFAIVLAEDQGTLLVGREDFAARLERYLAAAEHLETGLEVDLRFRDRLTCRRPDAPRP